MATSVQPDAPARLAHSAARAQSTSRATQPPGRTTVGPSSSSRADGLEAVRPARQRQSAGSQSRTEPIERGVLRRP